MGVDTNGARFIVDCMVNSVSLGSCAMLGRQEMHLLPSQLEEVFRRYSVALSEGEAEAIINNDGEKGYAEAFLKKCGATGVTSFDNSDYEGATHIHDMNRDVPSQYYANFDCVIDSGTLEHIFDVPVALRNCMRMVKPGGHFLSIAPCNNFMGHGFYQFSPELFYGVFSAKNGFTVDRMFIYESQPGAQWYSVADPSQIGGRVELTNSKMTYILVQARRISDADICDITPQQSDYVPLWNGATPAKPLENVDLVARVKRKFRSELKKKLKLASLEHVSNPFRKPWYEPYE